MPLPAVTVGVVDASAVVQALLDGVEPPLAPLTAPDESEPWPGRLAQTLSLAWHDLAAGRLTAAQNRHWRLVHSQPEEPDYLPPAGSLAHAVAVKRLSALVYLDEATFVIADDAPPTRTPGALGQRRRDLDDLLRRARRDALAAHDRELCRLAALIERYGVLALAEPAR